MQAIVLAAGFGKRLRPLTDIMPKSLVEVNGTPLLINALNHLSACGIEETVIVTGHMCDAVERLIGHEHHGMRISYVENVLYCETNNVYSLYLARDYIRDDALLLECDLFYQEDLVRTIMGCKAECGILVSRYNPDTMDGTAIEANDNGQAMALVLGKRQGTEYDYAKAWKTVNVYRFQKDFLLRKLLPAIELYVKSQSVNSYYEVVLGALIYFGNSDIQIVPIDEQKWSEIDDLKDLKRAEERFH